MSARAKKLTDAETRLLQRAAGYLGDDPDGVPFMGYSGRLATARNLKKRGLADFLVPGRGRMPRILITAAGRAALRSHGQGEDRK